MTGDGGRWQLGVGRWLRFKGVAGDGREMGGRWAGDGQEVGGRLAWG